MGYHTLPYQWGGFFVSPQWGIEPQKTGGGEKKISTLHNNWPFSFIVFKIYFDIDSRGVKIHSNSQL
jgi:hypothetical protein